MARLEHIFNFPVAIRMTWTALPITSAGRAGSSRAAPSIRGQIGVAIGEFKGRDKRCGTVGDDGRQAARCGRKPLLGFGIAGRQRSAPPVDAHEQELPFGKITWQNFERLCRRLASTDGDVEYCRLYGTEGQEQGGIDIYVRRRSRTKYATWQSKRHKSFSPGQIETAVDDFLKGDWPAKSDRFVLCVQASLRSTAIDKKIEECAAKLRERGVEFLPLDGEQLSERLKGFPEIVYDFFGLAWVERFCGKETARSVEKRLTPAEFRDLKARLSACYTAHFSSVDPGVLSLVATKAGARRQLPLAERFVPPDLTESTDIAEDEPAAEPTPTFPQYDPETGLEYSSAPIGRIEERPRREKALVTLENWIVAAKYEIVLGLAGSGKSTLLRFIALDMLSASPKLVRWRKRMPDYLPVWVPFAFWTKLIAAEKDECSLIDAIEAWFRRQDEPDLIALVRKAYDDKRLFLLVDGIDEWENETAAIRRSAFFNPSPSGTPIPSS